MYLDQSNINAHDIEYVIRAMQTGCVSTACELVTDFEKAMADYLGVSEVVATNSGTSALHLALLECGVGPGDEVIVPALTFIATANAVTYTGAKPVFVDVDPDTWCMNPNKMKLAISDKTKAVMPVSLYGNPCDMGEIVCIINQHNEMRDTDIFVIEDAAESIGAKYGEYHVGTMWKYGCFSFNGNKTMTTGAGGLVVGDDLDYIRKLSTVGKNEEGFSFDLGYNYRMPALNAALGLSQLERLDEFLEKKRRFNEIYRNELDGIVKFQEPTENSEPSWWYTTCIMPEGYSGEKAMKYLRHQNIPSRAVFTPLGYWDHYRDDVYRFPEAFNIYYQGVCLPSSTLNNDQDIFKVCKEMRGIL